MYWEASFLWSLVITIHCFSVRSTEKLPCLDWVVNAFLSFCFWKLLPQSRVAVVNCQASSPRPLGGLPWDFFIIGSPSRQQLLQSSLTTRRGNGGPVISTLREPWVYNRPRGTCAATWYPAPPSAVGSLHTTKDRSFKFACLPVNSHLYVTLCGLSMD